MIPVDPDRLREAVWDHRQGDDDTILEELVQAVLDAPTVWWCAESGLPMRCLDGEPCGMVALVPVKGGQE